jgi:SAM-dependent methyltransferase
MSRYDAFNEYEREMWSSDRASSYDQGLTRLTTHTADRLLDAVGASPGIELLDVGTGPGLVAERAAIRGCAVTGIDISPQMLAIARERVRSGEFHEGSAESLPFADDTFGAIVGNFVVLHLGHPDRLAAEAARVLRPGGRAAFTVWGTGDRNRVLGVFPDALTQAAVAPPNDIPEGPLSTDYADHDRFASLLRDGGFSDVRITEIEWTFTVDPGRWWDDTVASTPRTGGLVSRQSPEIRDQLRAVYDAIVAPYIGDDGLATFPAVAILADATR